MRYACIVAGCHEDASPEDTAVVLVANEELRVHLCWKHIEMVRVGQLDALSVTPTDPTAPPTDAR